MRTLQNLFRPVLWAAVVLAVILGLVMPGGYLFIASTLPFSIDGSADIETQFRRVVEGEREADWRASHRAEAPLPWATPQFLGLPPQLVVLFLHSAGCPQFLTAPRESPARWVLRLVLHVAGPRLGEPNGECELNFSLRLANRLQALSALQNVVAADRVRRALTREQMVAYLLASVHPELGVVGAEAAARELFDKPLKQLSLAQLAQLQMALPPWGLWNQVAKCENSALLKASRDALVDELVAEGTVSREQARAAAAVPLRCP